MNLIKRKHQKRKAKREEERSGKKTYRDSEECETAIKCCRKPRREDMQKNLQDQKKTQWKKYLNFQRHMKKIDIKKCNRSKLKRKAEKKITVKNTVRKNFDKPHSNLGIKEDTNN
ncbi:MAG: hypothetical protein U5J96_17885 [Ignavibacteriaceae bacterium]|nr:hypothetical protein [Ignavibacteriaceae bacterium]